MNQVMSRSRGDLGNVMDTPICAHCGELFGIEASFCEACGGPVVARRIELEADSDLAVVSDVGSRRKLNQDAGCVTRRSDGDAVMVVADGVSTSWRSEAAARLAVAVIRDVLLNWSVLDDAQAALIEAIGRANTAVKTQLPRSARTDFDSPEATIVAALQRGSDWTVGWVGDSRAYRIGRDNALLLTTDDSWVEAVVAAGEMTRDRALQDSRAHAVTQTLGMEDEEPIVHTVEVTLATGQQLLLCTDGLWGYYLDSDALAKELEASPATSTLGSCRWLVERANLCGGKDNITVAICRVGIDR